MLISGQPATAALIDNAAQLGHRFGIHAKPIPILEMLASVSQVLAAS